MSFSTIQLSVKSLDGTPDDDGDGEFEGILSTDVADREGERVLKGAFNPLPASIPVHYSHDFLTGALPIGAGIPEYDDEGRLVVRGRYAPTEKAQEVRRLVNGGFITALSAGFVVTKRDGKSIVEADLVEGSLTATPVNPSAVLLLSKALDLKAGARNSAQDLLLIQSAHDAISALGDVCTTKGAAAETDTKSLTEALDEAAPAESAATDEVPTDDADASAEELRELLRQRARVWQLTA